MQWTPQLSIGVEQIDNQHKELFDRINSLVSAIRDKTCKYKIGDVVRFLDEYIVFHFAEEEKYMLQHNYPGYSGHKAQHSTFIANFSRLKKKLPKLRGGLKPGSYDLSVETNQVVVDWILDHIAKTDREFGKYLTTYNK